jgi:hypothetical protein
LSGWAHDEHHLAPGRFSVPQRGHVIEPVPVPCISSLGRLI